MPEKKINPLLNRKDKRMYIINQYNQGAADAILVTMTPTAGFTVGFNLTFTGSVDIDFKDGGGKEALTSGVEKTHLYAGAGTYIAEITGDLLNITKFIADNSKITTISNLKTGLLTEFVINNNLYAGVLDMSNAPINTKFVVFSNPGLTGITFASSGNGQVTDFRAFSCNLTGTLDLSPLPISSLFQVSLNPLLTGITFATSGNGKVTNFTISSCNFTGNLNLTNVPVGGAFNSELNPLLTGITFATSGNTIVTNFQTRSCNLTGTLNLSNVPVGGTFNARSNALLTNITFATSGNSVITNFQLFLCNITGNLNLTNVPVGGLFQPSSNSLLTSITFSVSGNTTLTNVAINNTGLPNIDFTIFPNSDGLAIAQQNCSLTATEHDNQVINLDNTGWINGNWTVLTGNTARTAASDTAYNNLIANGWTIT